LPHAQSDHLFVGDGVAGGAGHVNHVKALKTNFAAPFPKIRPRIGESIAEADDKYLGPALECDRQLIKRGSN
jgi:hypothetical protein